MCVANALGRFKVLTEQLAVHFPLRCGRSPRHDPHKKFVLVPLQHMWT